MKVKFGVIGVNPQLRANFIFACFPREKGELIAVCDHDPDMFEQFKKAYPDLSNVRYYPDYKGLISDPEVQAVFVAVRDQYHEEIAVAALEAGKAVYLEKPMAITIEGCDRILETAYRTGSKLMVGHNMRYMDFVLKMKEIIDSGVIGEIQAVWCRHFINYGSCYFRHWCSEQKNCTGLLLQKGAHDIDIIHWLAGGYTERVSAMGLYTATIAAGANASTFRGAIYHATIGAGLNVGGFVNLTDREQTFYKLGNGYAYASNQVLTDFKCRGVLSICSNAVVSGGEIDSLARWDVVGQGRVENIGISNGGSMFFYNGIATNIDISTGGSMYLQSGTATNVEVHAGGSLYANGCWRG